MPPTGRRVLLRALTGYWYEVSWHDDDDRGCIILAMLLSLLADNYNSTSSVDLMQLCFACLETFGHSN